MPVRLRGILRLRLAGAIAALVISGCTASVSTSAGDPRAVPSAEVDAAPIGPATREGFGVPYPSLAAALAAVDSLQSGLVIVVDTIVLSEGEARPTPDEIARVRLVRNHYRCGATARSLGCASIIWIETKRPQWIPR